MALLQVLGEPITRLLARYGYELRRTGLEYCDDDAPALIERADASGLSMGAYLEAQNRPRIIGRRNLTMERLTASVPGPCDSVLEIGPGTGIYTEKIIEAYHPSHYDLYETSPTWSAYLRRAHPHACVHAADGRSLRHTADESCALVTAHGVFVYLPLLRTLGYLEEMARVCRPQGWMVFDYFPAETFDLATARCWQQAATRWEYPVVISERLLDALANRLALDMVGSFVVPCHKGKSTYVVWRKTSSFRTHQ